MSKPKKASAMVILAAVEGGGTSFIVTVAELTKHSNEEINIPYTRFRILHQKSIPSSSPSDAIVNTANFFSLHCPEGGYDALGLATFGPVGVNPQQHETYGRILPGSPKKEWRNVDILSPILKACSTDDGGRQPCYKVDTDVNAPALAEFHYQTNHLKKKMSSLAYVTVGTGVGVGLVINSLPVHGMMHPEGGHVPIAPLDNFQGYSWGDKSPFRGKNTVEGTTSSVALTERLQGTSSSSATDRESLKDLPDSHEVWDHAANSLANLCTTLALVTSVEKIILGGGVMNREILYEKIRIRTQEHLNGYLDLPQLTSTEGINAYIAPSVWSEAKGGPGPGLVGALTLAQAAYEESLKEGET